jgi:two-component system sensor histidine kinase BaeS
MTQIFEPLFRGDRSRQRTGTGSGLGLAIVRAIVIAHGGTVEASPSPWGGLAMQLVLPVKSDQQGAPE